MAVMCIGYPPPRVRVYARVCTPGDIKKMYFRIKILNVSKNGKNRRFKRVYLHCGTFSHKDRENALKRTKIGKNGIFQYVVAIVYACVICL